MLYHDEATGIRVLGALFQPSGGNNGSRGPELWPNVNITVLVSDDPKALAGISLSIPLKRDMNQPVGAILESLRATAAAALRAAAHALEAHDVPSLEAADQAGRDEFWESLNSDHRA